MIVFTLKALTVSLLPECWMTISPPVRVVPAPPRLPATVPLNHGVAAPWLTESGRSAERPPTWVPPTRSVNCSPVSFWIARVTSPSPIES